MNGSHLREAGSRGGKRRVELYGNPGTEEGRRLGGLRSLKTHKAMKTGFKRLIRIAKPRPSVKLAELLGIFMGDGHVHTYQASVTTNSETDLHHAFFTKNLIEELFGVTTFINYSKSCKACTVVASSKEVCNFLSKNGMPRGNKIEKGITIPVWVVARPAYRRAFLRGLIDTDGCVYEDRHTFKGRSYSSTCIAFTSASPELRAFVVDALTIEGWKPTASRRDVRLRRRNDVISYAKIVGFSNSKHSDKITV